MFSFTLNIPYTIIGLLLSLASGPKTLRFHEKPYAFVLNVGRFWWATADYLKGARAVVFGHVVLLGPNTQPGDLNHELIHVKQYTRMPLIFPFLYYIELFRRGYKDNKYEIEAYTHG